MYNTSKYDDILFLKLYRSNLLFFFHFFFLVVSVAFFVFDRGFFFSWQLTDFFFSETFEASSSRLKHELRKRAY